MSTRIPEVHRPIGLRPHEWPVCGACGDVFPCADYVRALVEDEA